MKVIVMEVDSANTDDKRQHVMKVIVMEVKSVNTDDKRHNVIYVTVLLCVFIVNIF